MEGSGERQYSGIRISNLRQNSTIVAWFVEGQEANGEFYFDMEKNMSFAAR